METAFTNSIAVVDYKVRSFLLFFSDKSVLKAFFFTPKTYCCLSPTHSLPLISRPWESLQAFLSTSRLSVNIETKEFNFAGSLLGGGACCAKGSALEQERLKPNKWTLKMQTVSSCTDNTQVELLVTELDTALLDPKFEEFRDVLTEVSKVQWKNSYAKTSVIEVLLKAAEKLYATNAAALYPSNKSLCEQLENKLDQFRFQPAEEVLTDLYSSSCLDCISSALTEISTDVKSAEIASAYKALVNAAPKDLNLEAEIFREKLIASAVALRIAVDQQGQNHVLDVFLNELEALPWQVQVIAVHNLGLALVKLSEQEQGQWVESKLGMCLLFNNGPNSWRVRITAVQTIAFLLSNSIVSDQVKGQISYLYLKALDTESNEDIRSALKQLPRNFLDPPLLCTSLPGDGQGGVYKLKTGDLKPFAHVRLHGTARVTPTLKGSIVVTGGIFNPKQAFEIDIDTSAVRELPTLHEERYWHAACLLGHEIVVCGGRSAPNELPLRSAEKLSGDKWIKLPDMNCRRESHACAERKMRIYAVGGLGDDDAATSIEVLERDTWTKRPITLPLALLVPGVIAISKQEIVIVGGRGEELRTEALKVNLKDSTIQELPALPQPAAFSGNSAEAHGNKLLFLSSEGRDIFIYDNDLRNWISRQY